MKRFFVFFLTLFIIFNWIHAENEAYGQNTFTVELEAQEAGPYSEAFKINVTFGANVHKNIFETDDIDLGGDAADGASIAIELKGRGNQSRTYVVTITPGTNSGELTIDMEAGAITKGNGATNEAATQLSVTIDVDAPTVTSIDDLPDAGEYQTEAFDLTVNFSEDVTGFDDDESDITLGGTATATFEITEDAEDAYTVKITPTTQGTVTVTVPANAAEDTAGNGNEAFGPTAAIKVDPTPPTVTLSGKPSGTQNGEFTITITFSEDVTGFDDDDITFGGTGMTATADVSGSEKDYTAEITPTGSGDLTIKVAADAAEDAAEHGNTVSNTLTVPIDTVAPTVSLSNVPTTAQNGNFTITITFNENVTGFDSNTDDITLDDDDASFTISKTNGKVYTAEITPSADGDLTIQVPAGAAVDGADIEPSPD